jgi:hypothetical protein
MLPGSVWSRHLAVVAQIERAGNGAPEGGLAVLMSLDTAVLYSVRPYGLRLRAGSPETEHRLHGSLVAPNLIAAGFFVRVSILSLFLGLSGPRPAPSAHTVPQNAALRGIQG